MKSFVLAILFVGLVTAEQSEFFSKVKRVSDKRNSKRMSYIDFLFFKSATSGDDKTCFNKIDDCCQGNSCDFGE